MSANTSRSAHYCGVNVPAETGKMSRSDKRGATLPKVATTRKGSRNDGLSCRVENSVNNTQYDTLLFMLFKAFFSSRETCAWDKPISLEISVCVLPS